MDKTLEQHFADWESHVFGFGYGSGEEPILDSLKGFMGCFTERNSDTAPANYDFRVIEHALGKQITWLLINTLCHANVIEYGTSPRFGWLTDEGVRLKEFIDTHTVEQLCIMTERPEGDSFCYPDHCNCDSGPCRNPFWKATPGSESAGTAGGRDE